MQGSLTCILGVWASPPEGRDTQGHLRFNVFILMHLMKNCVQYTAIEKKNTRLKHEMAFYCGDASQRLKLQLESWKKS